MGVMTRICLLLEAMPRKEVQREVLQALALYAIYPEHFRWIGFYFTLEVSKFKDRKTSERCPPPSRCSLRMRMTMRKSTGNE
ncbi:hypothetical protein I308_101674 [Cryptococcus tetragattii IND107]|uniref:Uncharacterized protein n=1 Tax=Cryptococcus tetragattii IND107 TaxID=1296105 RepID=A0ABR3BWM5_9TREE